jgi:hypothetical protein
VHYPLFLSDFNQTWNMSANANGNPKFEISQQPSALKSRFFMRICVTIASLNMLICGLHWAIYNKSRTRGALCTECVTSCNGQ